jgi:Mg-chelatase subunit ChlD
VSLVRSPIVVALPRAAAGSLGWPQRQPGWAELTAATVGGKLRFSMGNPMRSAAGLLAMLGVHAAMGKTTSDQGIAQMRALTLRSRLADASADPATLLQRLESLSDPAAAVQEIGAFPVTEQAVWVYQMKKPSVPLAAIYPGDGLMEADYPLALAPDAAADRDLKDIATRLIERFQSAQFAATIREQGFRPAADATPEATPPSPATADGLLAQYPTAAATPSDPALVTNRAAQWARYERLNYQVLILLDASASMNDKVRDRSGTVTTKAALLRTAGVQAAQLFGLDTSVGVWLFATPTPKSPPYVEAVPFGPLDEPIGGVPRREVVRRMAESYNAYERAGTPLYETVLRGVDAMKQLVKPGTVTIVVALTDGRDQDTRFSVPGSGFLSRINAARDPQRPVPVFCIGYGADADMAALNDISRATGGRAAASNDPGDLASAMAQIFLAAHTAQ